MTALQLLFQFLLSLLKWLTLVAVAIGLLAAGAMGLFSAAFPKQRAGDFEHLVIPDSITDCYACHAKMTPKLAHDWYESAHRIKLVTCSRCHGHPDGTGAIPFTARPDERTVCGECHDSAIQHIERNFGIDLDCNGCHPFHQSPLHRAANESARSETEFERGDGDRGAVSAPRRDSSKSPETSRSRAPALLLGALESVNDFGELDR